eukprot:4072100-Alexandrium_andersonii.AAC.1
MSKTYRKSNTITQCQGIAPTSGIAWSLHLCVQEFTREHQAHLRNLRRGGLAQGLQGKRLAHACLLEVLCLHNCVTGTTVCAWWRSPHDGTTVRIAATGTKCPHTAGRPGTRPHGDQDP